MSDFPLEWSPAAGLVGCAWVGTVAAAGWFVATWQLSADPAGMLLAAVTAIGLGVAAVFGSRARPRLRADIDGVTVGGLLRSRHHPWPFVDDIRVLQVRRFGRATSLLELDTISAIGDERLLVFGRLDLAADPEDVAASLRALRPARS
jgi:Bacterial PH domain